jgi:uncharacterized protein (DUF488 family)
MIYTIGHSTRPLDEFILLLKKYKVKRLIDVRTIPRSRHNPQFNKESLGAELKKKDIKYINIKELGGLRKPSPSSPNTGWRNASFRGFADYMQTPEFAKGLTKLINLSLRESVAVMCAEALPWRCHRSMIADALLSKGLLVGHILSEKSVRPHTLTPFARIKNGKIYYPEK